MSSEVRELVDFATGKTNFKILRLLHEKPMHAGDLGERLHLKTDAVRVHLHRLKKKGFVDYNKVGRRHLYHLKTPFDSKIHELIMLLISQSEPVRKRGEDSSDLPVDDLPEKSGSSHLEYLQNLLEVYMDTLVNPSPMQEAREMAQEIRSKQEQLRDKIDD